MKEELKGDLLGNKEGSVCIPFSLIPSQERYATLMLPILLDVIFFVQM